MKKAIIIGFLLGCSLGAQPNFTEEKCPRITEADIESLTLDSIEKLVRIIHKEDVTSMCTIITDSYVNGATMEEALAKGKQWWDQEVARRDAIIIDDFDLDDEC